MNVNMKRVYALQDQALELWRKGHGAWDFFGQIDAEWEKVKAEHASLYTGQDIGDRVGPGWWAILDDAMTKIEDVMKKYPAYVFSVRQIKEKFGSLRFYYALRKIGQDEYDDEFVDDTIAARDELFGQIAGIIDVAEQKASETCEWCGEPGHTGGDGWVKTLCDKHHDMSNRKRYD